MMPCLPRPLSTVVRIILAAASRARRHRAEWVVVVSVGPDRVEVSGNLDSAPGHVVEEVAARLALAIGAARVNATARPRRDA